METSNSYSQDQTQHQEGGGIRYLSTFSGIGGFELGIQAAHPDAECIGFSEIDKYAASVYQHNFKGAKNYGDITKLNPADIPPIDALVGGFPCQAFSVAGKRLGFDDTRGTLFFDVARLLKAKRPRHLVLENVKGLLSHDGGKTFTTILGVLADLGYFVEWQVLNSKDFGVPQNRERIYIVGHLGGKPRRTVFPLIGSGREAVIDYQDRSFVDLSTKLAATTNQARTLQARYSKGYSTRTGEVSGVLQVPSTASTGFELAEPGVTNTPTAVQKDNMVMYLMRWERTEEGKRIRRENQAQGIDYTPFNGDARQLSPAYDKSFVGTLTSQAISKDSLIGNNYRIRRLTPKECERLQGFPDDWTRYGEGEKEMSDTQRYKMCGNAVTTNVVRAVFERLANNGN